MTPGDLRHEEEPTILGHQVAITASLRGKAAVTPETREAIIEPHLFFAETGEGWKVTTPKYNQSKPRCEKTETYAIAPPTGEDKEKTSNF